MFAGEISFTHFFFFNFAKLVKTSVHVHFIANSFKFGGKNC